MNEIRFAARETQREFHWAWYLVPSGSVAIVLLSTILAIKPAEAPAPTLAANATLIAAATAAGPVLAAKPAAGWPTAEFAKQPPTLK